MGTQKLEIGSTIVDYFKREKDIFKAPKEIYAALGIDVYDCIDANADGVSYVFDLNKNLRREYNFSKQYHMVTNLGVAEHCFNQYEFFKNMHELCLPERIMFHHYPTKGETNWCMFLCDPRMFIDLAIANNYDILGMYCVSGAFRDVCYYSPEFLYTTLGEYIWWRFIGRINKSKNFKRHIAVLIFQVVNLMDMVMF